jgi:NTE family protein
MPLVKDIMVDRHVVWDRPPRPRNVGLVLGGGAARGIAHVGALLALEEQNIFPQVVVGTSVGALVGGLYTAGISPTRMAALLPTLRWLDLVSVRIPTVNWSDLARTIPMGLVDLDKLIDWIEQLLGGAVAIEQLNVPFAAVATDIQTGELVVMNEGPLAPAIRASCSVPGVFTPYTRGGRLLVDGVVANNLPVTVAQDMGADYVIGVDLLPLPGEKQIAPRNVVELSISSLFMLARATQIEQQLADIVVSPDIAHIGLADLAAFDDLIRAGHDAMAAALPEITRALGE